ncbi:MAG: Uma2 family endonuclease [Cyanobacteria bacterium P01_F01_bin.86]
MVVASAFASFTPLIGEKRVIFYRLDWHAYQQILNALGNHRTARLHYLCGTLEITMPLEDHEFLSELIGRFIYFLVSELGQKIKTMGSTTLEREHLNRGAEPDKAYYIQNQAKVAGKTVDLKYDPPPDLVVEVDITHSDIEKLTLYAAIGVSEFWRYNGKTWSIYQLQDADTNYSSEESSTVAKQYIEVENSPSFPFVPKAKLYEFLEQARLDEIEAETDLRKWIREIISD